MPNRTFQSDRRNGVLRAAMQPLVVTSVAVSVLAAAVHLAAPASADAPAHKPMTRLPAKANAAGVGVNYRFEGEPANGAEIVVIVELMPASDAGPATVRFSADTGLELKNAPTGEAPLESTGTTTFRLGVVPDADGLRYLNVFTTQNGAVASSSIAIQTGKRLPKGAVGTLKTAPDGERLVSHPVK